MIEAATTGASAIADIALIDLIFVFFNNGLRLESRAFRLYLSRRKTGCKRGQRKNTKIQQ
jgi:hypothetical protein